jgi:hypothetical protein
MGKLSDEHRNTKATNEKQLYYANLSSKLELFFISVTAAKIRMIYAVQTVKEAIATKLQQNYIARLQQ